MSFTDQGVSQARIWAIIGVAVLHALLAYAFVTGLAYKFVKSVSEDLKTFEVAGLISSDDYPPSALRNEEQGTVRVRLSIDTSGRVTNCSVTQSSGSSQLDSTTCRLLQRRARFTPARDNRGQPIADTITSPPIRWQIQQ